MYNVVHENCRKALANRDTMLHENNIHIFFKEYAFIQYREVVEDRRVFCYSYVASEY